MKQVKLIDRSIYEIQLLSQELKDHFNGRQNCTDDILHQFDAHYYERYITKNDKTFLDLGANIGLFALHVTPWAEKIVCVEPTPSHFALLTQLTNDFKNISRIQGAVSNKTGKATFYTATSNTTINSLLDLSGENNHFDVNTFSIQDLVKQSNIDHFDFIKIDIEGSEVILLTDETIEFLSKIASKIFIEFHPCVGRKAFQHRDHYARLFDKYFYTERFDNYGLFCKKSINGTEAIDGKLKRNKLFANIK